MVKKPNTRLQETNRLSLSYGRVVPKSIDSTEGLLPESFDTYNIVRPGDVVLRLTDLQNDQSSLRVGLVEETGIITSAYVTLRPTGRVDGGYLAALLKGLDAAKHFYALGAGVRQSLKFDELRSLNLPILPDHAQSGAAVRAFEEEANLKAAESLVVTQIDLLNERRAALVSSAVTGLDLGEDS